MFGVLRTDGQRYQNDLGISNYENSLPDKTPASEGGRYNGKE